jgi:hypothetical protein
MALSWELGKIKDYKTVCWIGEKGADDRRMNPVTEALIFGTMSVGLGAITDKNVDEFAARFRVIEKIHGAMLYKYNEDVREDWYLSDEDFIAHIGLTCNVANETRTAWARRIFVNTQTSETEQYARRFRANRERAAA